jgi:hypothetical protein
MTIQRMNEVLELVAKAATAFADGDYDGDGSIEGCTYAEVDCAKAMRLAAERAAVDFANAGCSL